MCIQLISILNLNNVFNCCHNFKVKALNLTGWQIKPVKKYRNRTG